VTLTADELGDARYFIVENSEAKVTFFKNKAVSVDIDNFVVLEVTETQPNIKGDTSGGGGKPATMSTGLTITVPFHINVGDKLKIDTRSKNYVEKMK
jgi:elongation factor P